MAYKNNIYNMYMEKSLLDIIDQIPSFDIPLIFNNDLYINDVKNLLLIDSIVSESQLFYNSSNQNTFPIIYSNNSSTDDFIKLLEDKFRNGLERIAFVFHDNIKDGKAFLNQELFFLESDFEVKDNISYSQNTKLLIDIIKKFGIKNIDFLACNSLNYPNWVKFYGLLEKETGVIVGASNDKTGNLRNGGNWLMENTNENVVSTYFNSNIESYASTLAVTVLSTSTVITQALVNSYTWPVTVNGGTLANPVIISFGENIILSNSSQYFITDSQYIIYDGTGKLVTVSNVASYQGLIRNGYSNVTVKNINSQISGSSSLQNSGGWICQGNFGGGANNVLIDNCSNSDSGGGICGERVGGNGGTIIITNCSNSGVINPNNAGGICGREIGINNGTVSITNCSNSGVINGVAIGGMCGNAAGRNNGIIIITNCYNTGTINGSENGGMTGRNTCFNNGTITISNCYNTGIIGSGSGGMCGAFFAWNTNNLCTIKNCYNIGNITGNIAGGFFGYDIGYSTNLAYTSNILIENCYSLGNIGTNAGGICGGSVNSYTTIPVVNITNCYTSYNSIDQAGSEYISLSFTATVRNSIISRLTNVYTSLISSWSDSSANSSLIGTAWTSVATNTPYLLSSFNASLYSPSTITSTGTGNYTSSSGLFNPDYNYNLISVNNSTPPSNITINSTNGVLTFVNLTSSTYIENVFCYQGTSPNYYGYNFNNFTLNYESSPEPPVPPKPKPKKKEKFYDVSPQRWYMLNSINKLKTTNNPYLKKKNYAIANYYLNGYAYLVLKSRET